MSKQYISAQELLVDSFKLADQIYQSGFRPQFIVGIWRGGTPVGIAVQEYFDYKGVKTDHIAVRTSSYSDIGTQSNEIKVHGLHYLLENANAEDSLLIIDDVFDSGRSVDALVRQIKQLSRANAPKDIRVACPWYKPANSKVDLKLDYYLYETDRWLVFPHELSGLTPEEIIEGKSDIREMFKLFI